MFLLYILSGYLPTLLFFLAVLVDTSATETEDETKKSPKRGLATTSQRGRKKKLLGNNAHNRADMKRKGRRARRKSKDKANNSQPSSLNRLTGFKARKNAVASTVAASNAANAAPNHRKLHVQQKQPATPKVRHRHAIETHH